MHVLHRPHLPRAVMITVIAAVLAIVLTLILASAVNDLRSPSSAASTPSVSVPALNHQTLAPVWKRSPFAPLLRTPVLAPWAEHPPVLAS